MRDNEVSVLFDAIGKVLSNQDKIMKHLGLNKLDSEWGYEDSETERLRDECYSISSDYSSER